jgi:hypothetical protein
MSERTVTIVISSCSECPHLGQAGLLHEAALQCELSDSRNIDVPYTKQIPEWCPLDYARPSNRG